MAKKIKGKAPSKESHKKKTLSLGPLPSGSNPTAGSPPASPPLAPSAGANAQNAKTGGPQEPPPVKIEMQRAKLRFPSVGEILFILFVLTISAYLASTVQNPANATGASENHKSFIPVYIINSILMGLFGLWLNKAFVAERAIEDKFFNCCSRILFTSEKHYRLDIVTQSIMDMFQRFDSLAEQKQYIKKFEAAASNPDLKDHEVKKRIKLLCADMKVAINLQTTSNDPTA